MTTQLHYNPTPVSRLAAFQVTRIANNRFGKFIGRVTAMHDGSMESVDAAFEAVTERMYEAFEEVSNSNSPTIVTDAAGSLWLALAPNGKIENSFA